jgi:hypothetical protein
VIGQTTHPLGLYDLIPPALCADFDHSRGITIEEIIRIEGIIVGLFPGGEADTLAADCGQCSDPGRDGRIDLCDLLRGVDEMVASEGGGNGRRFTDAGAAEASERGATFAVGQAMNGDPRDGGMLEMTMPVEIESRFPLAGVLVEIEVRGGRVAPELGPDARDMSLTPVLTDEGHLVVAVRRNGTGPDLPAGTLVPVMLRLRTSGAGEVKVTIRRAEAVAADLTLLPVHVESEASVVPARLALAQNRPNPFNPMTVVPFALPAAGRVELLVYDVSGRLVRRLIEGTLPAGFHDVQWDGRDDRGVGVASGISVYSLRAGGEFLTRKMVLLR